MAVAIESCSAMVSPGGFLCRKNNTEWLVGALRQQNVDLRVQWTKYFNVYASNN